MADETTRIINLTEATETDSGMYFVTDSPTGTKKVSIETLIDSSLTEEMAAAPASSVGENASDISALQTQMETKAEIDGLYEDMTVGNAEQLIASDYVTDKAPYLFRKTGGATDVGNREYDTLVGASVVWNQLARELESPFYLFNNATGTFSNGVASFTATAAQARVASDTMNMPYVPNHTYMVFLKAKNGASVDRTIQFQLYAGANYYLKNIATVSPSSNFQTVVAIIKPTIGTAGNRWTAWAFLNSQSGEEYSITAIQHRDLTTFFGSSTIPDYVYTLEQSTAGSGVAWLRQYFPKLFEYHEYDAGTLKSVEGVESHDMVGFNQWDEEWENGYINNSGNPTSDALSIRSKNFNRCVPNAVYYFKKPSSYAITPNIVWYDANKEFISRSTDVYPPQFLYTSPSNASFFKISCYQYGSAYNHDICINLSNSGYRNGEYEPYWKRSYPLDSTWVGRGIYKLGSDGKPYADGDRYESDGSGEVRYGVVDLGSLTWTRLTTDTEGKYQFSAGGLSDIIKKPASLSENGSVICAKYITISGDKPIQNIQGIAVHTNGNVLVYDESLATVDASAFKTAMSGIYLIYELATPTSATYEPFQSPQICDDFGTEEYVTNCLIPVGHETKYPANLRDKVQHLPDLSNLGNGNYIVNQTGTQMSLIPITSIIPAVPTEDGNYTLKCTVASGTATLSWEVEE